jgi:hypothetical protein
MENEIHPPQVLFTLFEAAGIQKKFIARRLGVSRTLVTMWDKGHRALTWPHFEALLDYAFDPDTIWKLATRLKKTSKALRQNKDDQSAPPLQAQWLVYALVTLDTYRNSRIAEEIRTTTQELAACTQPSPLAWDWGRIDVLYQRLTDDMRHAPFLRMHSDDRLKKAIDTLKEALGEEYAPAWFPGQTEGNSGLSLPSVEEENTHA